jgi:hypothetical protein
MFARVLCASSLFLIGLGSVAFASDVTLSPGQSATLKAGTATVVRCASQGSALPVCRIDVDTDYSKRYALFAGESLVGRFFYASDAATQMKILRETEVCQ